MSKKKEAAPTYQPSKAATEMQDILTGNIKGLLGMSYEDILGRYDVPEAPISTQAAAMQTGLLGGDYTPTSYEDFLKQIKPEGELYEASMTGYKGLIGEDYGIEDYKQIEKDYLDTVLGRYKETRGEGREALQESLIAENLLGSGPGYGLLGEYGEETARGVGDISKTWAYEGIQREITQRQYQDALKRGDYQTMYNIALQESQTKQMATQLAEAEKEYYDALKRGDIQTAFNMGQLIKQTQAATKTQAMATQLGIQEMGQGLFGTMTAKDLAEYEGRLKEWQTRTAQTGNLSTLGTLLGVGTMLATGGTMGGSTLAGAAMGGAVGGLGGSLFTGY